MDFLEYKTCKFYFISKKFKLFDIYDENNKKILILIEVEYLYNTIMYILNPGGCV